MEGSEGSQAVYRWIFRSYELLRWYASMLISMVMDLCLIVTSWTPRSHMIYCCVNAIFHHAVCQVSEIGTVLAWALYAWDSDRRTPCTLRRATRPPVAAKRYPRLAFGWYCVYMYSFLIISYSPVVSRDGEMAIHLAPGICLHRARTPPIAANRHTSPVC